MHYKFGLAQISFIQKHVRDGLNINQNSEQLPNLERSQLCGKYFQLVPFSVPAWSSLGIWGTLSLADPGIHLWRPNQVQQSKVDGEARIEGAISKRPRIEGVARSKASPEKNRIIQLTFIGPFERPICGARAPPFRASSDDPDLAATYCVSGHVRVIVVLLTYLLIIHKTVTKSDWVFTMNANWCSLVSLESELTTLGRSHFGRY